MADDEFDSMWRQRRAKAPRPSAYRSHSTTRFVGSYVTKQIVVNLDDADSAINEYERQYPPAAYGTNLISKTPHLDGTITLKFERYRSAD